MQLKEFFSKYHKAALAFSGGTDSAYLLYAAQLYGADVKAYFVKSEFQPSFEEEDAVKLSESLGAKFEIINAEVLSDDRICANAADRCYYCKKRIFCTIKEKAEKDGYGVVLDGTNASDASSDRPGMRAAAELGVLSPLKMCGIDKPSLRSLSRKAGLFTADKPSYSCLATRIAQGERISAETLNKIEAAEKELFASGYSDFRVRVKDGSALLEISKNQKEKFNSERQEIFSVLGQYFDSVGFSGIWR